MREGRRILKRIWDAFAATFATDASGERDPRHDEPKFRDGYGMALYWDTLARWTPPRARRDATFLGVPLVFLQAVDQCSTLSAEAARRLLNVPNLHNTGNIPGVLAIHVGMKVRFTRKLNATLGLVQEQRAIVVGFVFHIEDQLRYVRIPAGELFRPTYQMSGIWLQVDDFIDSPMGSEAQQFVVTEQDLQLYEAYAEGKEEARYWAHVVAYKKRMQDLRARGLVCYEATEAEFTWRSSEVHTVKRAGFCLKHADFFTSTSAQGQTLRGGVTIDCARLEPQGDKGLSDTEWWLHLYVLFSRAACMEDPIVLVLYVVFEFTK